MTANVEPIFPRVPFLKQATLDNSQGASPRTIATGANPPKVVVEGGQDGAIVGDLWAHPIGVFSTVVLLLFHRDAASNWNLLSEFQVQAVTNAGAAIARQPVPLFGILSPNITTGQEKKQGIILGPDEALGVAALSEIPGQQELTVWAMGGYY